MDFILRWMKTAWKVDRLEHLQIEDASPDNAALMADCYQKPPHETRNPITREDIINKYSKGKNERDVYRKVTYKNAFLGFMHLQWSIPCQHPRSQDLGMRVENVMFCRKQTNKYLCKQVNAQGFSEKLIDRFLKNKLSLVSILDIPARSGGTSEKG